MSNIYDKDPEEVLDYVFNFATLLGTDTITGTPTITVPTGMTLASQSNTTTAVTVWLSGGTAGTTYQVECKIVTAGGRTFERSIFVTCIEL